MNVRLCQFMLAGLHHPQYWLVAERGCSVVKVEDLLVQRPSRTSGEPEPERTPEPIQFPDQWWNSAACGCWYVLSVETVRDEIQLTLDKNPQNCREFSLSWIGSDRDTLSEIPFFATGHTNKVT